MDVPIPLERLIPSSPASAIISTFLVIYGVHLALVYLDVPVLPLQELLWNATLHCIPARLLLDPVQRQELEVDGMLSRAYAAKSDALRRLLGLDGSTLLQNLSSAADVTSKNSNQRWSSALGIASGGTLSEAPAGLGNWDNSCYQNSVLQALAALNTLRSWLRVVQGRSEDRAGTTNAALLEMVGNLRDASNNGRHIWTPAQLKNMSSWQQQDAQEYYSKIMDELDKEAVKTSGREAVKPGLESAIRPKHIEQSQVQEALPRNPLEGLIAQRVTCTSCDFSEGYSMIPFNCLTVPLGPGSHYDIAECLNEYTKREAIEGVECRRCTLLRAEEKIKSIAAAPSVKSSTTGVTTTESAMLALPSEVRMQVVQRLQAIQVALAEDDYSDKTLKQDCQIAAKGYVSSTKTREAQIGRAPQTLVIHVNRSVFDEMTGSQRKNYAHVRYPLRLDLTPWMLGIGQTSARYTLRAVVTHYGRHENGHYICYRQHPTIEPDDDVSVSKSTSDEMRRKTPLRWWRLSDEDVSSVTEWDALDQGGVFMLFYERDSDFPIPETPAVPAPEVTAESFLEHTITPVPLVEVDDNLLPSTPSEPPAAILSSSSSITSESDADLDYEGTIPSELPESIPPHAPMMRTAAPANVRHDIPLGRSLMSV